MNVRLQKNLLLQGGGFCWPVTAGVLWGAAILIRPNNLAALPIGLACFVLLRGCRTRTNLRRLAIVTFVAAITLLPWVLRNEIVMGKPTIATLVGGYTFWGANNDVVLHDPQLRGWLIIERERFRASHGAPPTHHDRT